MTAPPSTPAAGWYPDPAGEYELRYWDGSRWTDRVRDESLAAPEAAVAAPPAPPPGAEAQPQQPRSARAALAGTARGPLALLAAAGLVIGGVVGLVVADDSSAVDRERRKAGSLEDRRDAVRDEIRMVEALAGTAKRAWPTGGATARITAFAPGDCFVPENTDDREVPCGTVGSVEIFAIVDDFTEGGDDLDECQSRLSGPFPPRLVTVSFHTGPGQLRLICAAGA